jgi:hypothetical protein
MSDKSKLSYYFTRKTEIPLQESSNTMLGLFVAGQIVVGTKRRNVSLCNVSVHRLILEKVMIKLKKNNQEIRNFHIKKNAELKTNLFVLRNSQKFSYGYILRNLP